MRIIQKIIYLLLFISAIFFKFKKNIALDILSDYNKSHVQSFKCLLKAKDSKI